jgi:hypothetical protein
MRRLQTAADLLGDRYHRRPSRWMIPLVIEHRPYRSLADLRRKLVGRLAHQAPPSQELEPSTNPGRLSSPDC